MEVWSKFLKFYLLINFCNVLRKIYYSLFLVCVGQLGFTQSVEIRCGNYATSLATNYTDGSANDSIYVFCESNQGALRAIDPLTPNDNHIFEWYSYNYQSNTFSSTSFLIDSGKFSNAVNLQSGGYQVVMKDSVGNVLDCAQSWVFVDSTLAEINPVGPSCDSSLLFNSSVNSLANFTYFNPPEKNLIIDSNTIINVEFQANHTFVSDLAFYLIGPPSCGSPTIQLGDEWCCCNQYDDIASLTFSNTSNAVYDICQYGPLFSPPNVLNAGPFGQFGANGAPPTPINWPALYGCDANTGGWAVQIYDCVNFDFGSLTRAVVSFSGQSRCGQSTITYDSGPINSAINDNSCSAATASIFQVPINPLVTTPITLTNNITNISWSSNNPSVTFVNGNTANPTVQGLNSQQFTELYLSVSDNFGCVKTDTFTNEYIQPSAVSSNAPGSVCLSFGQVNLTANPPGGTWSGTGITNPTGTFDPTVAGIGTHTITYNTGNPCDTALNEVIEVAPNLVSTWNAPDTLCNPNVVYDLSQYLDPAAARGGRWSGPGVFNDSLFQPGAFGNYTLQYRVAFNDSLCADSFSNTIIVAPTMRVPQNGVQDVSCNAGNDGFAWVQAAGGQLPYAYQWNDTAAQTNDTAFNLSAGTYIVTITDSNACAVSDTLTVNQPTALNITLGRDSAACFGTSTGRAWVSYSGGTPNYTISWNDPGSQTTDTASNLSTAWYTVTVTDNNNCQLSDSIFVPEPSPLLTDAEGFDVSCFGGNDGVAMATASGGTGPYSYAWNDPGNQTSDSAVGLTAGSYQVTITDANGCQGVDTVIINQPTALQLISSTYPSSCFQGSDGWASVLVNGGTTPYNYAWNDPGSQTSDTAIGLTAGIYTVTVTDSNNCQQTAQAQVNQPAQIQLTLNSTQTRCPNSSGGTATVNVTSGGVSPFTYAWDDPGNQSTQTAVNLTVGLYTVTVTDDSGCSVSDTISVTSPNPLTVNVVGSNVSCFGLNDGSAQANISGGTTPYSIIWDDPAFQTTPTASNLGAGTYIVEVTDDSSCVVLDTIVITEPAELQLQTGSRDATCNNSNDGIGFVSVSGGTPNYTYAWNDPASQTNDTASNLPVGNYRVVVTDANGCADSNSISINAPPPIEVLQIQGTNPLCNGGNNGRAVVLAGGGSPGYNYAWSDPNNQSTATATGLAAGTYTVTITDAAGCTLDTSVTLTDPPAIQGFVQSVNQPTCFGLANGSVTIGQNNGTPPYRYLLGGNTQSSPIFNGLAAGNYVIVVADVNNCFDSVNVMIPSPSAVQITTQVNDVTCYRLGDGEIIVTANGGTPPYRYRHQLNNYQSTNVLNGLTPGTYHVSVLDSLGCLATDSNLVVTEPPVFTISAVADSLSCKGSGDGRITVSITGGVPPFDSYAITSDGVNFQNQSSPVFTGLDAGTYTVTALDGNNCPASVANILVDEPEFSLFSDTVIGTSCFGEEHQDGAIFLNGIGDNPPFRFSLNGGPFEQTNVFRDLGAGPYSVVGQDANGCLDTFTITVPQPDPIVVIVNPPIDTIDLGNSIQLSTNTVNTVGPLRYDWTPNLGLNCDDCPNPVVTVYESTRYQLTVTDLNKPNRAIPCTGEAIVDIIVLPERPTFIPNMFTPNGDGLNDVLLVYGSDIATLKLSIFSRWGEEIFVSNSQSQGWDGSYKGEPVPPGVYAYQLLVTYLNGEEDFMKGTITVVR